MAPHQPAQWLEMDDDVTDIFNFDASQATVSATYSQLPSQVPTSNGPRRLEYDTTPPAATLPPQYPLTASSELMDTPALRSASAASHEFYQGRQVSPYRDGLFQSCVQQPPGLVSRSLATSSYGDGYGTTRSGPYPGTNVAQNCNVERSQLYEVTDTDAIYRELEFSDFAEFTDALRAQASADLADNADITNKLWQSGVYSMTQDTQATPQNDSLFQETEEEVELVRALQKRKSNTQGMKNDATPKKRRGDTTKNVGRVSKTKNAGRVSKTKETRPSSDAPPLKKASMQEGASEAIQKSEVKGRFPCKKIAAPTGDAPWTAVEILTFAPALMYFRACADRFARNGWHPMDMALVMIYARPGFNFTIKNDLRSMIDHNLTRNHKVLHNTTERFTKTTLGPVDDMSPAGWGHRRCRTTLDTSDHDVLIDYTIIEMVEGVPRDRFPTRGNRGPVTDYLEVFLDFKPDMKLSKFCDYIGQLWSSGHVYPRLVPQHQRTYSTFRSRHGGKCNHDEEAYQRWLKFKKDNKLDRFGGDHGPRNSKR